MATPDSNPHSKEVTDRLITFLNATQDDPKQYLQMLLGLSTVEVNKVFNQSESLNDFPGSVERVIDENPAINPYWLLTGRGAMVVPPKSFPKLTKRSQSKRFMRYLKAGAVLLFMVLFLIFGAIGLNVDFTTKKEREKQKALEMYELYMDSAIYHLQEFEKVQGRRGTPLPDNFP